MYFDLQEEQLNRVFSRGWLRDQRTSPEQLAFLLPSASGYDAPLDAAAIDEPAAPIRPRRRRGSASRRRPRWRCSRTSPCRCRQQQLGRRRIAQQERARQSSPRHAPGLRLPHIWYRAAIEIEAQNAPAAAASSRDLAGHAGDRRRQQRPGRVGPDEQLWRLRRPARARARPEGRDALPAAPPLSGQVIAGDEWGLIRTIEERIAVAGGDDEVLRVQETAFGPVWERRRPALCAALGRARARRRQFRLDGARASAECRGSTCPQPARRIPGAEHRRRRRHRRHRLDDCRSAAEPRRDLELDPFPRPRLRPFHTPGRAWPRPPRIRSSATRRRGRSPPPTRASSPAQASRRSATAARTSARASASCATASPRLGAGTDEAGVYSVFLDDRALYLAPWRDRALQALAGDTDPGPRAKRDEFKRLLETTWTGRASVDSVGYRLTRAFVASLYARLFGSVDETMKEVERRTSFSRATSRWPAVIARLLDEQPAGWLPQGSADWRAVQLAAIDDAIASLEKEGTPLAKATWGQRNTTRIVHPMAAALPLGMRWLAAPAEPMPGDSHMPRVAAPDFGQSERFAVSPGHEASGVFQHAGRTERSSAESQLSRRPRRLGRRPGDAAAAGTAGAYAQLRAALRAGRHEPVVTTAASNRSRR
jgi:penicillin amidase